MISKLNNPDVIEFIQDNLDTDPTELILAASRYPNLPIKEIAGQLISRKKARNKLPEWHSNPAVIFPNHEYLQQSSSQITAEYKAGLFSGESLLDLTGGTGIDAFYMSKAFQHITVVEPNSDLCELLGHNFNVFDKEIDIRNEKAEEFLQLNTKKYDLIYLDPSRRDGKKERVVNLEDYSPNVLVHLENLFKISENVLIKVSPMIDIKQSLESLKIVKRVICLAVNNELKEILLNLDSNKPGTISVETVDIQRKGEIEFNFTFEEERNALLKLGTTKKYLYEPNVAIRKAGAFKLVGNRYNLEKVDQHTHLYTSDDIVKEFPGKTFFVHDIIKPTKRSLKTIIKNSRINIISKNYPESASAIKKRFKLSDGGDDYLIFYKDYNQGNLCAYCSLIR